MKNLFSQELENWLKKRGSKTLASLIAIFAERSFAVIFLVLMIFPALPIPTGGVTHVFEIITMLVAVELIVGRNTIWLPKRWLNRSLGSATSKKITPFILKRVKWFESHSKPYSSDLLSYTIVKRLAGLLVFVFALAAFLAPPFTGLDTFPALGAVTVALSLLVNDLRLFVVGVLAGLLGIGIVVGLSEVFINLVPKLF
jgi:hypothetical protein